MIENEYKLMLSKEQYERLLTEYDLTTFEQVNHYYDTDDLQMSERHITVRVRELDGRFYLQMKLPTEANTKDSEASKAHTPAIGSSIKVSRVELSKELDALPETLSAKELSEFSGVDCPALAHIGTLKTTRSIWEFDGGELDIDRSEYFDKTDYELEIEFTDEQAASALLSEITDKLGSPAGSEVCKGKIRRFLEEYKKSRA